MYIRSCHTLLNNTVLAATVHPGAEVHTLQQGTHGLHFQPCTPPLPLTLKTLGKLNSLLLSQVTSALSFLSFCICCSFLSISFLVLRYNQPRSLLRNHPLYTKDSHQGAQLVHLKSVIYKDRDVATPEAHVSFPPPDPQLDCG